jgi:hypothetical protein
MPPAASLDSTSSQRKLIFAWKLTLRTGPRFEIRNCDPQKSPSVVEVYWEPAS